MPEGAPRTDLTPWTRSDVGGSWHRPQCLCHGIWCKEQSNVTVPCVQADPRAPPPPQPPVTYPGRPDDHSRPPGERHVRVILEAPADGAVSAALLTGLQLLQETEVTRHHCKTESRGRGVRYRDFFSNNAKKAIVDTSGAGVSVTHGKVIRGRMQSWVHQTWLRITFERRVRRSE